MQDLNLFIAKHIILSSAVVMIFILLTIVEFLRAKRKTAELSPQAVTQKINREHAVVIDIRPSDVYKHGHIIDSRSVAADSLQNNLTSIEKFKTKPIIVVGLNSVDSQKIAAFLIKAGYNAYALAGGMRAWKDAQLPIIKG